MYPHFNLKLLWQLIIHPDFRFAPFIQTHLWSNQNFRYSFFPHCPFRHIPWCSVKRFLKIKKMHLQPSNSSMIHFLKSQNKHSVNCSFLRHKIKLHFIDSHYFTQCRSCYLPMQPKSMRMTCKQSLHSGLTIIRLESRLYRHSNRLNRMKRT